MSSSSSGTRKLRRVSLWVSLTRDTVMVVVFAAIVGYSVWLFAALGYAWTAGVPFTAINWQHLLTHPGSDPVAEYMQQMLNEEEMWSSQNDPYVYVHTYTTVP